MAKAVSPSRNQRLKRMVTCKAVLSIHEIRNLELVIAQLQVFFVHSLTSSKNSKNQEVLLILYGLEEADYPPNS